MNITQLLYFIITMTNVQAFISSPIYIHKLNKFPQIQSSYMSNDYLENINKYTKYLNTDQKNIKKLDGIRKNITNYIKAHKDDNIPKIQNGMRSTYQPIPKATFDTIFMNINQIKLLYISSNVDRIIFEMRDNRRYVYYISNKDDYKRMEQLMNLVPTPYKSIIINDVCGSMDDPFGFLYCDQK